MMHAPILESGSAYLSECFGTFGDTKNEYSEKSATIDINKELMNANHVGILQRML